MTLKLLVTSDFHQKEELKDAAIEEVENGDYDIYINLGDYMDESYAKSLFDGIDIPAVGCTGNRDMHFSEEFLDGPTPVYNFLEAEIDEEYLLILVGGSFSENVKDDITELIEEHGNSRKVIIGSHYPPHKVGDLVHNGSRIGFEKYREIIIKEKPLLWMNGHVHEDFGEKELMRTKVLNAASCDNGKAFAVTIDGENIEKVEELQLVDFSE